VATAVFASKGEGLETETTSKGGIRLNQELDSLRSLALVRSTTDSRGSQACRVL